MCECVTRIACEKVNITAGDVTLVYLGFLGNGEDLVSLGEPFCPDRPFISFQREDRGSKEREVKGE